ncbi:MAG: hypothetical protein ACRDPK_01760, partial [Carbonactinosporaceae bacterium]
MMTQEFKKFTESKPFHAAAGAGDLAVEKLRDFQGKIVTLQSEVPSRIDALQNDAKALPSRIIALQAGALSLPQRAQTFAVSQVDRATEVYGDLAKRGRKIVTRVKRQKATGELRAQARTTVARAKATRTTAGHGVASTRKAAQATTTAARRTAGAA